MPDEREVAVKDHDDGHTFHGIDGRDAPGRGRFGLVVFGKGGLLQRHDIVQKNSTFWNYRKY